MKKNVIAGLIGATINTVYGTEINRLELPVKSPKMLESKEYDIKNVKTSNQIYTGVKAPKNAPNVVIIMLDDVGFSMSSTLGGQINTPTFEKLSKEGVLYNQFHTASISSSTRASLLTGRNHHMVNMGTIMDYATPQDGYTSVRVNQIAALPKILKYNGYATSMFGKTHEIPSWEQDSTGSTYLKPPGLGFDKFYGFYDGSADQKQPVLVSGNDVIPTPRKDNGEYNLTTDLVDQAITWVNLQKDIREEKPFFLYLAPGATHAPHQPPKNWINKYKGKFDKGWDVLREETFAKQKELGIIPKDSKLSSKPEYVADWNKLTDKEKKVHARQFEIYAAFLEYTDYEMGRFIENLKKIGQYDNTVFVYIMGDNGASPEGGNNGIWNEYSGMNGQMDDIDKLEKKLKELDKKMMKEDTQYYGGNFSAGWAYAGSTPFAWPKTVASDFGATRNGMVVAYPNMIKSKGEKREQWSYVTDIAPTILDLVGVPEPKKVEGIEQIPMQGVSLKETFLSNKIKSEHKKQYFEMFGNRAIYNEGWFARTIHKVPYSPIPINSLDNDKWELYNLKNDFSLSEDLSNKNPDKLEEMKRIFHEEAKKNFVYPLNDRGPVERRPKPATEGKKEMVLHDKAILYTGKNLISVKNKSHMITAEIEVENPKNAEGVLFSQGQHTGGYVLYVENGYPVYTYNFLGDKKYSIKSDERLKEGFNEIKMVFKYDENGTGGQGAIPGAGLGKGGNVYLYLNGNLTGKLKVDKTVPVLFGADEVVFVGQNDGSPVDRSYEGKMPFKFNGTIEKVKITIDSEKIR